MILDRIARGRRGAHAKLALIAMCVLCALAPGPAAAGENVDEICRKAGEPSFPRRDRPTKAETRTLRACDSESLYYGIGRPADPAEARKCAFLEMGSQGEPVLGGSNVLMMIYANGKGAARDIDLAIALACWAECAPAERKGRIEHLLRMKAARSDSGFDLCDDITSGYMQGVCAMHAERRRADVRARRRAAVVAALPSQAKPALAKLDEAAEAFFKARVENEVDRTGTARAALQIEELARLQDGFVEALERLQKKELPPTATAEQFQAVDAALNAAYARIMSASNGWGTVTKEGVREAQRQWIRYRDAWVGLANEMYPDVPAATWRAWITGERTKMLAQFS